MQTQLVIAHTDTHTCNDAIDTKCGGVTCRNSNPRLVSWEKGRILEGFLSCQSRILPHTAPHFPPHTHSPMPTPTPPHRSPTPPHSPPVPDTGPHGYSPLSDISVPLAQLGSQCCQEVVGVAVGTLLLLQEEAEYLVSAPLLLKCFNHLRRADGGGQCAHSRMLVYTVRR